MADKKATENSPAEPVEGYSKASTDKILKALPEYNQEQLEAAKNYEEAQDEPNTAVIQAIDAILAPDDPDSKPPVPVSDQKGTEDIPKGQPGSAEQISERPDSPKPVTEGSSDGPSEEDTVKELQAQAADLDIEGRSSMNKDELIKAIEEASEGDKDEEPFAPGSLRNQAELASGPNPTADDPTAPDLDTRYAEERDPVDAVRNQESPTSSAPDDLAQREALAQAAAEPLKREVERTQAELPETQIQHAESSAAADAGAQYPPQEPSVDDQIAKRDADTAEAEEEAEKRAKKAAKSLEGDDALVAQAKSTAPPALDLVEEDPSGAEPFATTLQVGDKASRLDRAHDEIGIVVSRHEPFEAGLVDVQFSDAGVQTLNVTNLRYEGNDALDSEKEAAYANSEQRAF